MSDRIKDMSEQRYWDSIDKTTESSLDDVRTLLSEVITSKSEDKLFAKRLAIDNAIAHIDSLLSDYRYSKSDEFLNDAIVLKLKLLRHSRKWSSLLNESKTETTIKYGNPQEVQYHFALALWNCGHLNHAMDEFQKLSGELDGDKKRMIKRCANEVKWLIEFNYDDLCSELLDTLSGRQSVSAVTIKYYDQFHGDGEISVNYVNEILRKCQNIIKKKDTYSNKVILPSDIYVTFPNVIFTSGFQWSGSGAVTDYLTDMDSVISITQSELYWIQGRSNTPSLFSLYCSGHPISVINIIDFILCSILGLPVKLEEKEGDLSLNNLIEGDSIVSKTAIYKQSAIGLSGKKKNNILDIVTKCLNLIESSSCISNCINYLMETIRDWIRILSSCNTVVMNNAIKAYKLRVAAYFPGAKVVIVGRDPRDQFCAKALESNNDSGRQGVKKFISHIEAAYRKYEADICYIYKEAPSVSVMTISFESFVLDENVREKVRDFVGLTTREKVTNKFQPDQSANNIGIFKKILTDESEEIMQHINSKNIAIPQFIQTNRP